MDNLKKKDVDRDINIIDNNPDRDFAEFRSRTAHRASSFSDKTDDLIDKVYYAETGYDLHKDNLTKFFLARAYDTVDRKKDALTVAGQVSLNDKYSQYYFYAAQLSCKILLERDDDLSFHKFVHTIIAYPDFANNWPLMDGTVYGSSTSELLVQGIITDLEETLEKSSNDYRNLFVLGTYKALAHKDPTVRDSGLSDCMKAIEMQPDNSAMLSYYPFIEAVSSTQKPEELEISDIRDARERISIIFKEKAEAAFRKNDPDASGLAQGVRILRFADARFSSHQNKLQHSVMKKQMIPFKRTV